MYDRLERDGAEQEREHVEAPPVEPGKRPLVKAYRKATSDGTLAGAHAATVVDRAGQDSSGAPMAADVRARAESGFGHDFSAVRVHTDGAAARASHDLNANAFTLGTDIYFDRGQYAPGTAGGDHLLAHELAHVVQGAGAAASASGQGATVSHPGDASEVAADAAADRFVRGEPVGEVGGPPRGIISCDALGDLHDAAHGGMFSSGNLNDVWTKLALLSDGEKAQLATSAGAHFQTVLDIIHLIASGADLVRFFREVNYFTIFWIHFWHGQSHRVLTKAQWDEVLALVDVAARNQLATFTVYESTMTAVAHANTSAELLLVLDGMGTLRLLRRLHWLQAGGHLATLTAAQWNALLIFAPPDERAELRGEAPVYEAFLRNAPPELIAPRERIDGLRNGAWAPTPAQLAEAVAALSPAQKTAIRADIPLMDLIAARGQSSEPDLYRLLRDLDHPVKWCIWFLRNCIAAVTADHWGEMCGGASAAEMAEVDGWAEVKTLYEANCPANLRTTRTELDTGTADPVAFTRSLNRARLQQLFDTLGAAGLLDAIGAPDQQFNENYLKARLHGFVDRVIAALPVGAAMGVRTQAALRRWFFHGSEDHRNRLARMFEKRFAVTVNDASHVRHNPDGLRQSWTVLESMPPAQVEGNARWELYVRSYRAGAGGAYTGGRWNEIEMEYKGRRDLNLVDNDTNVFQPGGQHAGSPGVPMRFFNSTLRHEIGHAVDEQLGLMARMGADARCGSWSVYMTPAAFVTAIIAQYPGGLAGAWGYPAADVADYQTAMINAVTQHISFQQAINAIARAAAPPRTAGVAPDAGPVEVVFAPARWSSASQPWSRASWRTAPSGLNFHEAYDSPVEFCSFQAARRSAHLVSDYQWRASYEWFAEAYQVYYAEQENDPNAAVGGILRSRDAEAAAMLSNIVDRGYSPQEMRGGGGAPGPAAVPAPGTSGAVGGPP